MSRKCKNCNLCKIPGYKKIIKNEEEAKVFSDCLNKTVIVNDIFCKKCRLEKYVLKNSVNSVFSMLLVLETVRRRNKSSS